MTNPKLSRREALLTGAGGAISLAAAVSLVTETASAAEETYSQSEIVNEVAGFFGVAAKTAADIVSHVFEDLGRPNAYITGDEGSGAIVVGLRYGKGIMHRTRFSNQKVYWQGPSVGFDFGGNASKCFTLVYAIRRQSEIYQRFPGVDGSAYFIGGLGVNYQRSGRISLAPIRAGVGFRSGVNVGYLSYTRDRDILPF
jgi:hypothetical protein